MKIKCIIYFLSLILFSCQKQNHAEVTYISSYQIKENGQKKSPNYSFIHLKNDSIFFRDLYKPDTLIFLGKIPDKKSIASLNGLNFSFNDNSLEISNAETKSIYTVLDKESLEVKIDKHYFENKRFVIESEFGKDTIFFTTENRYRNMSSKDLDRWSFEEVDGFKVLWLNHGHDEVPLIIKSLNNKEVTSYLYGFKKNEVSLKKIIEVPY